MFQNNKDNKPLEDKQVASHDAFAEDLDVDLGDTMDDTEASAGEKSQGFPKSNPEVAKLRKELDETKERLMRTFAELENFRKRSARQLSEELKYANMPLLRDLLPVLDNLQRAIESADKQEQQLTSVGEALLKGVDMVSHQFTDVLARHDCIRIEAMGKPFDPNFHQAITQMPKEDVDPNTIIMETQAGYSLFDRVVRPAQVIVSTGQPQ